MTEITSEEPLIDGKRLGEIVSMDHSERTMRQRIAYIIYERQTNLDMYLKPDSSLSQLMDQTDPTIRPQTIELYRAEIAALNALDPDTATMDDVSQIHDEYQAQRDSLVLTQ